MVGVDVAEDGLAHAEAAAAGRGLEIEFARADVQELPYAEGEFDGVASSFGAIFAPDRERAAGELARVCRPGGKLGLTLMPMDSRTGELFTVLGRYGREGPHPGSWEQDVERLLGAAFELEVEPRESAAPRPAPPPSWEQAVQSFAPLRALVERLDDDRVAALRAELDAVQERYRDRTPHYVIVLGRRR